MEILNFLVLVGRFPFITSDTLGITLKTSDALLIAIYGMEAHLSHERELPWVEPSLDEKVEYSG